MKPISLLFFFIASTIAGRVLAQDPIPTCNTQDCSVDFRNPLPGVLTDNDVAVYKGTTGNGVPYGKSATVAGVW